MQEALLLTTKATELFVLWMGQLMAQHAQRTGKRTVKADFFQVATRAQPGLFFLQNCPFVMSATTHADNHQSDAAGSFSSSSSSSSSSRGRKARVGHLSADAFAGDVDGHVAEGEEGAGVGVGAAAAGPAPGALGAFIHRRRGPAFVDQGEAAAGYQSDEGGADAAGAVPSSAWGTGLEDQVASIFGDAPVALRGGLRKGGKRAPAGGDVVVDVDIDGDEDADAAGQKAAKGRGKGGKGKNRKGGDAAVDGEAPVDGEDADGEGDADRHGAPKRPPASLAGRKRGRGGDLASVSSFSSSSSSSAAAAAAAPASRETAGIFKLLEQSKRLASLQTAQRKLDNLNKMFADSDDEGGDADGGVELVDDGADREGSKKSAGRKRGDGKASRSKGKGKSKGKGSKSSAMVDGDVDGDVDADGEAGVDAAGDAIEVGSGSESEVDSDAEASVRRRGGSRPAPRSRGSSSSRSSGSSSGGSSKGKKSRSRRGGRVVEDSDEEEEEAEEDGRDEAAAGQSTGKAGADAASAAASTSTSWLQSSKRRRILFEDDEDEGAASDASEPDAYSKALASQHRDDTDDIQG